MIFLQYIVLVSLYQIWNLNVVKFLSYTASKLAKMAKVAHLGLLANFGQHFARFGHGFCFQKCSPWSALSAQAILGGGSTSSSSSVHDTNDNDNDNYGMVTQISRLASRLVGGARGLKTEVGKQVAQGVVSSLQVRISVVLSCQQLQFSAVCSGFCIGHVHGINPWKWSF